MLFDQVSLPDLATIARRSVFSAVAVGIVALVACLALGAPLVGLGITIGIALGIANFRMVLRSVERAGRRTGPKRRPLALNTVGRLSIISAVALGLLFVSFDLGFGLLAGLAVFQFLLLFNVVRSMLKGAAPGTASLLGGLGTMFAIDDLEADDAAPPATPSLDAGEDD
jgi:hypothetical protein